MITAAQVDLKEIVLANNSFGPREIDQIVQSVATDSLQFGILRDAVAELESREESTPAAAVRLGVCLYFLGRYSRAAEVLGKADGGALAHFYQGKARIALQQFDAALGSFQAAKVAGYNSDDCMLAVAEAQRLGGKLEAGLVTLDKLSGAVEQTAEYLYQRLDHFSDRRESSRSLGVI